MGQKKFQFEYKLINDVNGDSAVYCFFPTSGEAFLYDLGKLENLTNRELLKVRSAFVSHTHIDHFIGFDRLLRVNIPHSRLINMAGPRGFIDNVKSKLKAYTWNLLEQDQIRFKLKEIHPDGKVLEATLTNSRDFEPLFSAPKNQQIGNDSVITVETYPDNSMTKAVVLDHGTDSIGYCFQTSKRYSVNIDYINKHGWQPGPWIRELKMAVTNNALSQEIDVNGQKYAAGKLRDEMLIEENPFALAYLTDFVFNIDNITKAASLAKNCDILICEACFNENHRDRALAKKHLTTKQAALIGAYAEASTMRFMHLSSIYGENVEEVIAEGENHFAAFDKLPQTAIEKLIDEELNLITPR